MDTYIVFWLAATVVFVLVELMTVGLTSIWFAAGSFGHKKRRAYRDSKDKRSKTNCKKGKGGLTGNGRINSTCSVTRNRTYSIGKLHQNRATGTRDGN